MSVRVPRGLPGWVAREIGLRSNRPGAFMSYESLNRLLVLAREGLRDVVAEYEVGVDYDASDYSSSDVSFNARIFREGANADDLDDIESELDRAEESGRIPRDVSHWFAPRGMTEADARAVLFDIAESGVVPRGFRVEAVDWLRKRRVSVREWRERRKRGAGRGGDADDLFNFRNVIQEVGEGGIRLGAVKSNKL